MKAFSSTALKQIADDFQLAYQTKIPIIPPRNTIEGLDLAGAYQIQQLQEESLKKLGRKVVGRKIGLTSLAMQHQLGVSSPDFGFFTSDLVFEAGAEIEVSEFISPKVEPELAFILREDLAENATFEEVVQAIGSVHLAIEIIDSRVANWDIKLVDTIADNASCGAVILDRSPLNISTDELPEVSAIMLIDGEKLGSGTGADVMGHPLAPLHWLAKTLGELGVPLQSGDIVLTGSFCGAAPVTAGQRVSIDYGQYGRLSASFI